MSVFRSHGGLFISKFGDVLSFGVLSTEKNEGHFGGVSLTYCKQTDGVDGELIGLSVTHLVN